MRWMKMCRKWLKRTLIFFLSAFLALSLPVVSFADRRGVMEPEDYVFFVIFKACGVSPGVRDIGPIMEAYKGYLESTHNNTLLSQVNGYSSLTWGDTVHGIDTLFKSVKNWLSLSDVYGAGFGSHNLPTSSLPLKPDSSMELYEFRVSSRIADVSCDDPDYEYLFSTCIILYNSDDYRVINHYAPKGQELLGVYSCNSNYCDSGSIFFYNRSGSDYSSVRLLYNYCTYDSSGVLKGTSSTLQSASSLDGFSIRSVSNLPFKVFYSTNALSSYCKTGEIASVFSPGTFLTTFNTRFYELGLQKIDDYEVGEALALPSDSSDALNCWNNFSGFSNIEALLSALNTGGMDITYRPSYKLEHYVQKYAVDGTYTWEKYSESSHTGVLNQPALIEPLEISGFTYAPELLPEEKTVLYDCSLVVPVYYTCDPASYKVEYYKQSSNSSGKETPWVLVDTEILQGMPGMEAEYSIKEYPNYLFDSSLTEPSDRKILSDGSLVVRLYYTPDPEAVYPYTVEYYKDGECFETVSKTVPMFGDRTVSEYEDFCPKYYLVDGETSTPLPFSVTGENHVIRVSYIPDLDAVYPYTVEYYKDGECFETVSGTVPVFGDQTVQEYKDVCPKYYLVDGEASTPLPFPVTEENHVIRVYYIPDTSNPYTPLARGTEDLVTFTSGFFGKVFLGVLALLLLGLFINRSLAFVKRTTSQAEAGKYQQGKKSDTPRRYSKRKGNRYKYRGRRKHANY